MESRTPVGSTSQYTPCSAWLSIALTSTVKSSPVKTYPAKLSKEEGQLLYNMLAITDRRGGLWSASAGKVNDRDVSWSPMSNAVTVTRTGTPRPHAAGNGTPTSCVTVVCSRSGTSSPMSQGPLTSTRVSHRPTVVVTP